MADPKDPFGAAAILNLGETSRRESPMDWAIEALRLSSAGLSRETIEAWPLGQMDHKLVQLRERQFGSSWPSTPQCTQCGEVFELDIEPRRMGFEGSAPYDGWVPTGAVIVDGAERDVRALIVRDLLALERCRDEASARAYLGAALAVQDEALDDALEVATELDPLVNIWISTRCPECGAPQSILFDPARFLAEEIARSADRVLSEVSEIALAYHWSEDAILAMPPERRNFYRSRIPM